MTEIVKCIDISHHQDFPDFEKVRAAGVIALIHKSTEGCTFIDPNRATNCANARAAGIQTCCYHWLSPDSDPRDQMAFFLKTIDPVPGERVVIDYEEDGCGLTDLKQAVQALLDDPRGLQITVYSGHLLKEQLANGEHDAFLHDNTDLWLAQYTTGTPTWPEGTYPQWTLWQYSESGQVDGISGNLVDLDRYNGDDAALLKWISPASVVPGPTPDPGMVPVAIDLTIPAEVSLTIAINGEVIYGDE